MLVGIFLRNRRFNKGTLYTMKNDVIAKKTEKDSKLV